MMKKATDQDFSKANAVASKAKFAANLFEGSLLGNLGISIQEGPDEKDYHLEADEINELFRVSQSQSVGICSQLCLALAIIIYILIDTVNNAGI